MPLRGLHQAVQGTAEVNDTTTDATVIAAPGTGKTLYITKAIVMVHTEAAGGGGLVKLEDGAGGTAFFKADADAVGVYLLDFGEYGYALSANTALNLTVDSAATTQASAVCAAVGYIK